MSRRFLALVIVVVLAASLLSGCGAGSNTIKIGTIQPISGPVSAYGTQSRDAIQMAVDEINAKGGVLGKQLQLVTEDDEATPDKAVNAFSKLVTKDKVSGIVGCLTTKCTLAITKEAQKRKVVMITPASTNVTVTNAGDYVFRACFIDSFQGSVLAQYAFDKLNAKTAAVIYDNTNDYSKGLKDYFKQKFEAVGGKVVADESYGSGDKDFAAQLTKIKAAKPDILMISDYYNTDALVAKQARDMGITATFVGGDGWDEIQNNAGPEVDGSYFSNHYAADQNDPDLQNFITNYKTKYKITPNALATLAYDAAYIMADAIQKAGSTDQAKVKDAMMQTDKKYVTGHIKFDKDRNPVKTVFMIKVVKGSDGKLATQTVDTITP